MTGSVDSRDYGLWQFIVLLSGKPGAGKSTLAQELCETTPPSGCLPFTKISVATTLKQISRPIFDLFSSVHSSRRSKELIDKSFKEMMDMVNNNDLEYHALYVASTLQQILNRVSIEVVGDDGGITYAAYRDILRVAGEVIRGKMPGVIVDDMIRRVRWALGNEVPKMSVVIDDARYPGEITGTRVLASELPGERPSGRFYSVRVRQLSVLIDTPEDECVERLVIRDNISLDEARNHVWSGELPLSNKESYDLVVSGLDLGDDVDKIHYMIQEIIAGSDQCWRK